MSKIYLFENPGNHASIVYDGSTLTEEQKTRAVVVDELPEPQTPPGKIPVLKVKKETGEVWYEYVDNPQTELEQRLSAVEDAVLALMLMGGGGE